MNKDRFTANARVGAILEYISSGWDVLTRSSEDCRMVADPKLTEAAILYLPAGYPAPDALKRFLRECHVRLE